MPIVMKIDDDEAPEQFNQKFVKEYWPEGVTPLTDDVELLCHLIVTDDPREARHFATFQAALDYWTMERGIGPDGEPHRPLCAWNVWVEAITL